MNKRTTPTYRSGKKWNGVTEKDVDGQPYHRVTDRFLHVSAAIIPKGTQIGVDKNTQQPILTDRNLVARGNSYVKPVEDVAA